jgi:hypothetical protein
LIEFLGEHLDKLTRVALWRKTPNSQRTTALCGVVLALNEEATGHDMHVILREVALRYAEE